LLPSVFLVFIFIFFVVSGFFKIKFTKATDEEIQHVSNLVGADIDLEELKNNFHKNKRIINGPRKIDLDIIFWDQKIFKNNNVVIPHPRAQERDFVLCPLYDITPFFKHPVSKLSVKELIKNLKDHYVIEKLNYRNLF